MNKLPFKTKLKIFCFIAAEKAKNIAYEISEIPKAIKLSLPHKYFKSTLTPIIDVDHMGLTIKIDRLKGSILDKAPHRNQLDKKALKEAGIYEDCYYKLSVYNALSDIIWPIDTRYIAYSRHKANVHTSNHSIIPLDVAVKEVMFDFVDRDHLPPVGRLVITSLYEKHDNNVDFKFIYTFAISKTEGVKQTTAVKRSTNK